MVLERITTAGKTLAVVGTSTAVAAWLQYGLVLPALGPQAPNLVFVLAILASAAYCGFWPGLLATALCLLIALDTSSMAGGELFTLQSTVPLILLALVGIVASVLAEELHRARRRTERRQRALQKEIADRRVVEQKVVDSEARFRELAESLPDIMFATDAAGANAYVNRRWSEYTGISRTPEGEAQRPAREAIHPDDLQRVRDAWRSALARGMPYETRHRLRGVDGSYRWFIARARPVWGAGKDEQAPRWFGVATDIDGQMRAEESLRDREEQLRLALESTGLGVFEIELTTRRMVWSDRCRSIFGYSSNEALTYRKVRAAIHPADRRRAMNAINRSRDPAGHGEFSFEMRIVHTDGSERTVAARGRSFFVANGDGGDRAVRCIGTMLDTTERRRSERQLRTSVADLQHAERSLRDADRRKDEFLAVLAHELRNPLAPIRSALQLISSAPDSAPAVGYARDVLERQVAMMVRLIDDLLDVGRITSGRLALRRERVALQAVIDCALEIARPLIVERRQSIAVNVTPAPVMLDCDPARISQVLANLLNNAARYSPPLGRITLNVDVGEQEVEVRVSDEGVGIAPEAIGSIFTMFSQAGSPPGEGDAGLGVGLPLARALTALHGGSIEARSAGIGSGTEFIVRLPHYQGADQPCEVSESAVAATTNGAGAVRRILVVDDNRDAAESLAAVLRISGHEVAVGHDGTQALLLAEQFRPEVMLLDVSMPKMNGHEATRRLRATDWGKPIYIVALSGFGQEQDRARSLEAGCNAHLTKPLSPHELEQALAGAGPTLH